MPLVGVDFTSRPSRRKRIVVAFGGVEATSAASDPAAIDRGDPASIGRAPGNPASIVLRLDRFETHTELASFAAWLARPDPWLGAFDLPFGLPRELVTALGWPLEWVPLIRHYAALSRPEIRATFAAFCAARPVGAKFAHRAADAPAGSSSPMKWVNPPVAFMLHAGVPLMLDAGVDLPGLHAGDPERVALEGYPGLLARELIGRRSYKNDTVALQTPARRAARADMVAALEAGRGRLGVRLAVDADLRATLIDDASGDRLDAALCLVQAAWAGGRPNHGLPASIDPLEGWIVSAPRLPAPALAAS